MYLDCEGYQSHIFSMKSAQIFPLLLHFLTFRMSYVRGPVQSNINTLLSQR